MWNRYRPIFPSSFNFATFSWSIFEYRVSVFTLVIRFFIFFRFELNLRLSEPGCFSPKDILSCTNSAARDCKSLLFLHPFLINFLKYLAILSWGGSVNLAAWPILWYLYPPNKELNFRRKNIFCLKLCTIFLYLIVWMSSK